MTKKRHLPEEHRSLAEELADRPYKVVVKSDETTDGQRIYLALNLELPGCMSHGASDSEAVENLAEARIEYIQSLLNAELPVPVPIQIASETSVGDWNLIERSYVIRTEAIGVERVVEEVIEPEGRELLYEASLEIAV